jgi:hypothetical protein
MQLPTHLPIYTVLFLPPTKKRKERKQPEGALNQTRPYDPIYLPIYLFIITQTL